MEVINQLEMTPEETAVLNLISSNERITQVQIARSASWLGSHPIHEGYYNEQSTLRRVRQIVRDLRMKHGKVILSDRLGYWIMNDRSEAMEYIRRMEKMAKAQAKAWFETYAVMKKNFGVTSEYFSTQGDLFSSTLNVPMSDENTKTF